MAEWAKSSFTEVRTAVGATYKAADGTELSRAEYDALPDWYQSELTYGNTAMGPRYTAPDGTQLMPAEYDALPPAPPASVEPEPEPEPEPGDDDDDTPPADDDDTPPADDDDTPPADDDAAPATPEGLDADRLKTFMAGDGLTDDQAEIALASATALVEGYTRGAHIDATGAPRPGVETVILTVAARLAANPGQISRSDSAGPFRQNRGVGFQGFTLAELSVLNRYRKRAIG